MVLMRAKMITVVGLLGTATLLPIASAKAEQLGHASWYALHSRTASGEMMNPSELTAAHRSLPFGTRVVVENLNNGQSVVVRINDRGPFIGGRIIDLSKAAATSIGMISSGTAKVRVNTTGGGLLQALGTSKPKIIKTAAVEQEAIAEPEKSAKMSATLKGVATKKKVSSNKTVSSKSASSKKSVSSKKSATIKSASRKSNTRTASAYRSAKLLRTASLSKKRYGTSRSTQEKVILVSKSARSSAKSRTSRARIASKTGRPVSKRSARKSMTIASSQKLYPVLGGMPGFMKGRSYRAG